MGYLPSEEYTLWQRLITRFNLKRFAIPPETGLSTIIQPVTSADDLLKDYVLEASNGFTVGGTGSQKVLQVPSDERWTVFFAFVARATGDGTYDGFVVEDQATFSNPITVATFTASASPPTQDFNGQKLVLGPGWIFGVSVAVWTNGNLHLRLLVEKEKVY